ncbi:MAG TPA: hypothetical protein VHT34_06160 [Clostridia bacterium]|nr:hypothetical protein [Clostridia bacterium]
MGNGFSKYLLYMGLILFFFVMLVFLLVLKLRKQKPPTKNGIIDTGNVSVFFDRNENAVIIPYVKDKFGVGRATTDVQFLNKPYNSQTLGGTLRRAMISGSASEACSDRELMDKLGFRGWKDFSEGKRNISVHYKKEHGLVFNTTIRKQDGSYQFNYPAVSKMLNNDISDRDLGETLLLLLQKCR